MQGDFIWFDQAIVDVFEKRHDFENDSFKVMLTDGSTTPSATTADPRYGNAGTTDFSAEEVAAGGNYSTGGQALANPSVTINAGVIEVDWDDPAEWAQHASNPTDATWAVIYNDTDAGKRCIGYIDIGGVFDMTTGPLSITFATPALTADQA